MRGISSVVTRQRIPDAVLAAAHARSRARAERNWPEADRLRAEIEAAGWRVVDRGTDFALSPAAPPTVEDGGVGPLRVVATRCRRGSTSRRSGLATVILVATDWPADLERALDGLAPTSPDGVAVVVVADGPSAEQDAALAAVRGRPCVEVVRTTERLGPGARR